LSSEKSDHQFWFQMDSYSRRKIKKDLKFLRIYLKIYLNLMSIFRCVKIKDCLFFIRIVKKNRVILSFVFFVIVSNGIIFHPKIILYQKFVRWRKKLNYLACYKQLINVLAITNNHVIINRTFLINLSRHKT